MKVTEEWNKTKHHQTLLTSFNFFIKIKQKLKYLHFISFFRYDKYN